jgi:NAD(P)-dependent dehydrogenase (short-subunit alcohol dehydrogenase family)
MSADRDNRCVFTAAANGIGRATTLELARRGQIAKTRPVAA